MIDVLLAEVEAEIIRKRVIFCCTLIGGVVAIITLIIIAAELPSRACLS